MSMLGVVEIKKVLISLLRSETGSMSCFIATKCFRNREQNRFGLKKGISILAIFMLLYQRGNKRMHLQSFVIIKGIGVWIQMKLII